MSSPNRLTPGTPAPSSARTPHALSVRNLTVKYGNREIFSGLSADFAAGRVHGLIGPNGAGKSTLIKAALGLVKATGSVQVNGAEVAPMSARERALAMAYLAQDMPAPGEFTGREIVTMGRYARQRRFAAASPADNEAVEQALDLSGAAPWADRPAAATSGGELQLTNLARALAQDAPVLFLDEPASALDMGHQLDVLALLGPWTRDGLGAAGHKTAAAKELSDAAGQQNAVAGGVAPASNSAGAFVESSGVMVPTPTFVPSGFFAR